MPRPARGGIPGPVKPALKAIAAAVVALALGVWLVGAWRRSTQHAEARLARERAKREFLERAAVARQLPGEREREWREEVRSLARWYGGEVHNLPLRESNGFLTNEPSFFFPKARYLKSSTPVFVCSSSLASVLTVKLIETS